MKYPFSKLEVIGYQEVPVLNPAMPRILTPIYRVEGKDEVIFSPYTKEPDAIVNPSYVVGMDCFDEYVQHMDISSMPTVKAAPSHELWLSDTGTICYQPENEANSSLRAIHGAKCGQARNLLQEGLLDKARLCALQAYSASPHNLAFSQLSLPLILRAAVEFLKGARQELVLTEQLIPEDRVGEFREMYKREARESSVYRHWQSAVEISLSSGEENEHALFGLIVRNYKGTFGIEPEEKLASYMKAWAEDGAELNRSIENEEI